MNALDKAIERLTELEPGLRSMDSLHVMGEISTRCGGGFQAGDFDFHVWNHHLDGFSAGAITRVRQDGNPFPQLVQQEKKWILCCKGELRVNSGGIETVLTEGERITILPRTAHEIHPVSRDCSAVIVTVPAAPGM